MTEIQKQREQMMLAVKTIDDSIGNVLQKAMDIFPEHVSVQKLSRLAMGAVRKNPKLAQANPRSILSCVVEAGYLGLDVNTPLGECFLVPRYQKNKETGKKELMCCLDMGYHGLEKLVYNDGNVRLIEADVVRDSDEFEYEKGLNPVLRHVPSGKAEKDGRDIIYVYAILTLNSGEKKFDVLTREQVEKIRNKSVSKNSPAWVEWYGEMAKKTAVKRLLKHERKSPRTHQAVALDNFAEAGKVQEFSPEVVSTLEALPFDEDWKDDDSQTQKPSEEDIEQLRKDSENEDAN